MAWRKVRAKKKAPPVEVVTIRPPRMKITPEESLRYMEAFSSERMQKFIDAARGGEKTSG